MYRSSNLDTVKLRFPRNPEEKYSTGCHSYTLTLSKNRNFSTKLFRVFFYQFTYSVLYRDFLVHKTFEPCNTEE